MRTYRAAVVGTGFIGPVHVEGLRRAGIDVAAIVGSSPEKSRVAAKRLGIDPKHTSLKDVLADESIGFPHGNSCTESKRYETELACRDGAVEIDMVINIGKALSGDWDYVEQDVRAVCDEAHQHGAKVKVIFENDFLTSGGAGLSSDDFKRRLCEICERVGADWVKTSSGYGFVKQPDGSYAYKGATEHDLQLMRASCSDAVQVKAAGGVHDLGGLIRVRDLGATRCGATATAAMLDEYRRCEATSGASEASKTGALLGKGGY